MILIDNVHKAFGPKQVLRGVSMRIEDGKTTVIIGRSGTGKSVLLKLIVGLLEPDQGSITIDGRRVDEMSEAELYETRRRIGYVFQGAALFDSMNVAENLVLGLYEHGEHDQARLEREVTTNLVNVGLLPDPKKVTPEEFLHAYRIIASKKPAELSGGMRKRVGVARALVGTPKYIFYDEPTTGLDPITSEQNDNLVCDLTRKLDVTSIVITHDIFSVYKVAHNVVMLEDGLIHFTGSPIDLQRSKDPIVQEFIERYALSHTAGQVGLDISPDQAG
jgi:phospholipid/cholesterol/gamma-HCH transport system ATP-binding protein